VSVTPSWIFDAPHYQAMTQARLMFIKQFLPELIRSKQLRTALDTGCGVGEFSGFLSDMGLAVTGVDSRATNIAEAQRRYPNLPFATYDIEGAEIGRLGTFDLVLCLGLLYHLENPMAALRNLHMLTSGVLLIESMIHPRATLTLELVEEGTLEDQSMRSVALVPSEPSFIKLLYRVGFSYVYSFRQLPDHEQFRVTRTSRRRRTFLIASHAPLMLAACVLEPNPPSTGYWQRPYSARIFWLQQRLTRVFRAGQTRLFQLLGKGRVSG